MRSKTYMSKINLQSGILTVENRRSREIKRICSEVSVNSPGNPWSQSRERHQTGNESVTNVIINTTISSFF